MLSMGHILILLLIVVLVFGTSNLRNIGSDLGAAVHNFKKAMNEGEKDAKQEEKKEVASTSDKDEKKS